MRYGLLIVVASLAAGYSAVFYALANRGDDEVAGVEAVPPTSEVPPPATVVELIDTECLLDPPPRPDSGLPFDPTEPLEPSGLAVKADQPPTAPPPRGRASSPATAPPPRALPQPPTAPHPRPIVTD
ncbi:MAG: hypothetical protein RMJ56_12735 [Gemmataceae bacterium]|nr:hypothetical protein [Gemmata sp.]MDW8198460.1 hypothetical protein [Gemmataceae bacterium]